VIVLPYGDQHRMGGVSEAEPVSITTFLDNRRGPTCRCCATVPTAA
jgi:hypothetical protein